MLIEVVEAVNSASDLSSSPEQFSDKQSDECPICGAAAFHKHFGSFQPTCKGCSAFFRRCVVFKKNFKCKRNDKCIAQKGKNKHGCQSCRFRKCLKNGMAIEAVTNKSVGKHTELTECGDSSLKKLIQFRNNSFTSRFKALLKVYGGDRSFIGTSGFLKTSHTYELAFQAEFEVCEDYVKCSQIVETGNSEFLNELSKSFMMTWLTVEVVSRNLRYHAFNQRRAYFTDDSYQILNEDVMVNYYNSYNQLKYTDSIAITAMKTLRKVVKVAQRFHELKITEPEISFCMYILLINAAKRLHPNPKKFDYLFNNLFRDLKAYYDRTYSDTAVCFGNLMIAIDLINELKVAGSELFIMISLHNVNGSRVDKYNLPTVKPMGDLE